jgi:hypothetical protein
MNILIMFVWTSYLCLIRFICMDKLFIFMRMYLPNEEMVKIKVVDLEKLHNFVVDNFFI